MAASAIDKAVRYQLGNGSAQRVFATDTEAIAPLER